MPDPLPISPSRPAYKFSIWDAVMGLLGIAVLCYISVKANGSSFTHDESFSYNHYVHTPFMDILSFKDWYTNNHILNSIGMKYAEMGFGSSELALRLPNLLLFVVYMTYGFLIFKRSDRLVALGIFALLCTNYILIDFFGLARGYGMSFGFMVMSLYHFIQYFEQRKLVHIILFHLGGLLSILSSFTLVDVYVALLALYPVMDAVQSTVILRGKYRIWPSMRVHILPFLINVAILYEPLRRVITRSELDFGGKKGFFEDTVAHVVSNSLHGFFPESAMPVLAVIFTIIVLASTIWIMRAILRRDAAFFTQHRGLIITNALLILLSAAIILQHQIFGADYPKARFSLFLVPLYLIHFGLLLAYLAEHSKWTLRSAALVLATLSCINLVTKADMRACGEWDMDMETEAVLEQLAVYHIAHDPPGSQVRLGINWVFEPAINFYRETKHLDWLMRVNRLGAMPQDNYAYVFRDNPSVADTARYEVILIYERINTFLLRNKRVEL